MGAIEDVSGVVERIYDAALDAALWPDALENICAFVEGCTANLFYQDTGNHAVQVFYSWGEDPHYQRLYVDTYAALNPLFPAGAFLEVGTVHALADVMPLDEFRATRMYREWVRPQGVLDVILSNRMRPSPRAQGGPNCWPASLIPAKSGCCPIRRSRPARSSGSTARRSDGCRRLPVFCPGRPTSTL
jgi:hypothetical protein